MPLARFLLLRDLEKLYFFKILTSYSDLKRVIAETGAGQHGVATATVAAKFGMKCTVFMGGAGCHLFSWLIMIRKMSDDKR